MTQRGIFYYIRQHKLKRYRVYICKCLVFTYRSTSMFISNKAKGPRPDQETQKYDLKM